MIELFLSKPLISDWLLFYLLYSYFKKRGTDLLRDYLYGLYSRTIVENPQIDLKQMRNLPKRWFASVPHWSEKIQIKIGRL